MKTTLKEHQLSKILYTKEKDGKQDVTERTILPTTIPKANIRAIDVSALNGEERKMLIEFHEEYAEYVKRFMKGLISFENWIEATHPGMEVPEIKHRTFKIDGIQIDD